MKHTSIFGNKSQIKKNLFIILFIILLYSLYYLSKIRNRNSKKEGLYSINQFISDFQTIHGHINTVRDAKDNAEFSLLQHEPEEDRYSAAQDDDDW